MGRRQSPKISRCTDSPKIRYSIPIFNQTMESKTIPPSLFAYQISGSAPASSHYDQSLTLKAPITIVVCFVFCLWF